MIDVQMTFHMVGVIISFTGADAMKTFRQWMSGRHGPDELSFAILILFMICWGLSLFFPSRIWLILEILLAVLCYYRIFSKRHFKRSQENARFLRYYDMVRFKVQHVKHRFHERKTHRFYTCPNCRQKLRVPKGKGSIVITCPKCRTKFEKRT